MATHPGLQQREGNAYESGADSSRARRLWSGRLRSESWENGCGILGPIYLGYVAPIFLKKSYSFPGKKSITLPCGTPHP